MEKWKRIQAAARDVLVQKIKRCVKKVAVEVIKKMMNKVSQQKNEKIFGSHSWSYVFLGIGKNFRLIMNYAIVLSFSRPFHENFTFLKNCPYDFHKNLHSHSTP